MAHLLHPIQLSNSFSVDSCSHLTHRLVLGSSGSIGTSSCSALLLLFCSSICLRCAYDLLTVCLTVLRYSLAIVVTQKCRKRLWISATSEIWFTLSIPHMIPWSYFYVFKLTYNYIYGKLGMNMYIIDIDKVSPNYFVACETLLVNQWDMEPKRPIWVGSQGAIGECPGDNFRLGAAVLTLCAKPRGSRAHPGNASRTAELQRECKLWRSAGAQ